MLVHVATLCTVTYTVQSENKHFVHCKHNAFVVGNVGFLVVVVLGEWGGWGDFMIKFPFYITMPVSFLLILCLSHYFFLRCDLSCCFCGFFC